MSEPQISSVVAVVNPHDMDTVNPSVGASSLSVRSFGLTDAGKVRATNEDQFLIAVLLKALQVQQTSLPQATVQHSSDRSYLFVVADGMGGHAGGEQASALAIDSVEPEKACRRLVTRANEAGGRDNITVVVAYFHAANQPAMQARSRPKQEDAPDEPRTTG